MPDNSTLTAEVTAQVTAEETQGLTATEIRIAKAVELGIPPCNWVPPEVPPLVVTLSQRNTYPRTLDEIKGQVEDSKPSFEKPQEGRQVQVGNPSVEQAQEERPAVSVGSRGRGLSIYPSRDNFKHLDPKDFLKLRESVSTSLQSTSQSGATLVISTTATQKQLQDLEIAKEQYARLELAFNLIVSKIGDRCIELNEALKEHARTNNTTAYEKARDNYVAFIQNLNIHDPEGGQIDPENGFGYGNVLGWTIADVVVNYDRTYKTNLITGVTIVGEWIGYHLSSSGVPIP